MRELKSIFKWIGKLEMASKKKKGLIDNDLHNFVYFHNSIENFSKLSSFSFTLFWVLIKAGGKNGRNLRSKASLQFKLDKTREESLFYHL